MLFVSQFVSQFCCDTSCTRNFKVYQLSQSTNLAMLKQPYIYCTKQNQILLFATIPATLQRIFKALLQLDRNVYTLIWHLTCQSGAKRQHLRFLYYYHCKLHGHVTQCNIPCNAMQKSSFLALRDKFRDKTLKLSEVELMTDIAVKH